MTSHDLETGIKAGLRSTFPDHSETSINAMLSGTLSATLANICSDSPFVVEVARERAEGWAASGRAINCNMSALAAE
jgi:hypothetical protein